MTTTIIRKNKMETLLEKSESINKLKRQQQFNFESLEKRN